MLETVSINPKYWKESIEQNDESLQILLLKTAVNAQETLLNNLSLDEFKAIFDQCCNYETESLQGCKSPEQLGADNTGIERGEHGKIKSLILENLCYLKDNLPQSDQKLNEIILSNNKLHSSFDNLFSHVYDKLDNFSKIMYRSFTDNAEKIESFSQSNLLSTSSLSTDMRQIKTMIENNERDPVSNNNSKENSRSHCHNDLNNPDNEITGANLKLVHELLNELNDKIENLIDSTVEPIKDIQQRLLIIENNQNRQFQSLSDKIDSLLNAKSESQQPMSYFQSDHKEHSTSCTNLPGQENSKGKSREVESPLHPKNDSNRSTSLYPVTSKEALDNFVQPTNSNLPFHQTQPEL
ncbi:hypothetical protein KEM48_014444 [Puccinia striiformis f. sp. tritici PST-130]|nr:hypothetical protein KEM48_014444 [Puccinia striiformis f. sp. tritici PST-130]